MFIKIWSLKSQNSENSRSNETECHDTGGDRSWCRGGNVVSEPGVSEVNAVVPAPDADPGHLLPSHTAGQREGHVLAHEPAELGV